MKRLSALKEHTVIICDRANSNYRKSKLEELVNMNSSSIFLKKLRNYDVVYSPNSTDLVTYNKKNMSITMPGYNPLAINDINPTKHHQAGCQFVCMNFQTQDANMNYYIKFFEENQSAFVLKPKNLRYIKTYITSPNSTKSAIIIRRSWNCYATISRQYVRLL